MRFPGQVGRERPRWRGRARSRYACTIEKSLDADMPQPGRDTRRRGLLPDPPLVIGRPILVPTQESLGVGSIVDT